MVWTQNDLPLKHLPNMNMNMPCAGNAGAYFIRLYVQVYWKAGGFLECGTWNRRETSCKRTTRMSNHAIGIDWTDIADNADIAAIADIAPLTQLLSSVCLDCIYSWCVAQWHTAAAHLTAQCCDNDDLFHERSLQLENDKSAVPRKVGKVDSLPTKQQHEIYVALCCISSTN